MFFYQYSPKIKLFLQKNAKISSAGGLAPRPPCLPRQGALPPDAPFLRRLGASPPTHNTAPQCEFLATPLLSVLVCYARILPTSIRTACSIYYLHLQQHTSARGAFQLLYILKTKARIQRKVKDDKRLALSSSKPRIPILTLWLQSLPSQ